MSLIHNNRIIFAGFAGRFFHLLINNRKFLQGGNNNPGAVVDSVPQILGGLIIANGFHHPNRVVKAGNRLLQLLVQYPAVCYHNNAAENRHVCRIMQLGQAVGRPGDRIGFAGAGAVLNQIIAAGPMRINVRQQLTHHIQLMITRKNQSLFAVLNLQMHKLLQYIQHTILLKNIFP